ncbi:uncharacterized protein LOC125533159 [Triticum urartu]|uniref:uncharacterized protein LOC125533159 n=1 Tax=Triticum urartu TaxID=4572 RepID=UPI0020447E49|nr:uncharacterized protein LOC125533159 [Triticum urartu]
MNQDQAAPAFGFEGDYNLRISRIYKFPAGLRALGTRYIEPMLVAIGPYHRHLPHLQGMEQVKRLATDHFVNQVEPTREELYAAVLHVAGTARLLYGYGIIPPAPAAAAGAAPPPAPAGDAHQQAPAQEQQQQAPPAAAQHGNNPPPPMGDVEFADMLFHDACFLLQYIRVRMLNTGPPSLAHLFYSKRSVINNDIMLLENQLPWLVLSSLINLTGHVPVTRFIVRLASVFHARRGLGVEQGFELGDYRPGHLLALLRFHMKGDMTRQVDMLVNTPNQISVSFNAIGLEEIGIKLKVSDGNMFADMRINKRSLLPGRKLVLPPMLLGNVSVTCLVNMAALEVCTGISFVDNNTVVCSYVGILAMLMHREDDVHQLRAMHLVQGELTDRETLDLFTSLGKHLPSGERYVSILESIEEYKLGNWLWIAVHRFFYLYFTKIATFFAAIGSIAGVFKAFELIVVKKHQ